MLGWEITIGANREGFELEKADLFPTMGEADAFVRAYRNQKGWRTCVKRRAVKIDRAEFRVFAALVWKKVEVSS